MNYNARYIIDLCPLASHTVNLPHIFDRCVSSTFWFHLSRYTFTYQPSGLPLPPQDIRLPPTFKTIEVPFLRRKNAKTFKQIQTSSDHLRDVFVTKVAEVLLELQACPDGPFDGMTGESRKNLAKQLYKRTSEQWDFEVSDQYEAQVACWRGF